MGYSQISENYVKTIRACAINDARNNSIALGFLMSWDYIIVQVYIVICQCIYILNVYIHEYGNLSMCFMHQS